MQPHECMRVRLNGLDMHLRSSELESVAADAGGFGSPEAVDAITLAEALRQLPPNDRAPAWELAVRRFGRHTPLPQAAGQIGMDVIRAAALIERFSQNVTASRPPEHVK